MNLDGARNAKAEVFSDVFGFKPVASASANHSSLPLFTAAAGTGAHRDIVVGRMKKKRDARDLISLGIVPASGHNRDPDGMSLGVFIQRQDLRQHHVVDEIQRRAKGEVRIIYTGRVVKFAVNDKKYRPIVVGASTGHYRVTAGTIACACQHIGGGIGLLSNNHIFADTNRGEQGDLVLQPGRSDGGRRNDPSSRVAVLYKFIPIDFEPGSRNLVDCAFATLLGDMEYDCGEVYDPLDPSNHWSIRPINTNVLELDPVKKIGRTTGFTRGQVTALEIDNLMVAMVLGTGERLARFDGQISVESSNGSFSEPGDSGSLIFTEDGSPAALLFAGTRSAGRFGTGVTYGNPIKTVLEALDLKIHTEA